jgi:tetratricopeptide (TPR) repeat protein
MARRASVLAALLVLCGCGGGPLAPSRLAAEAVEFNQRGAAAYERRDLDGARAHYERALDINAGTDNAEGIALNALSLARVHQALREPETAHRYLERVLESGAAAPWRAEAAARKAQLHLAARELGPAAEWLARAEQLCSQCRAQAAILNLGARIALAGGQPALALQRAARALQLATGDETRAERANAQRIAGEARMAQGDMEGAVLALRHALAIDQALGLAERVELDARLLETADSKLRARRLASP